MTHIVLDARALDALPDGTLIRASGRGFGSTATFTEVWVRPIPRGLLGAYSQRLWQVLTFDGISLTTADQITYPVEVLYVDQERPVGIDEDREALAETIRAVIDRCAIDGVDPAREIADTLAGAATQAGA